MPFPEFIPTLDEKFKFATFSLTRLNSESIFSLIVTPSSLTFTSPSFVSGSLVSQTTNPQVFDVYSVVSVTGAGVNPFTLNSDGTYNYQIPTPLPTTNLVLTYLVTRGSQTATATLTLIFNPFPLCTIEDPNTSLFNLKIYHNAGTNNLTVNPSNTFDGLSYPRLPIISTTGTSGYICTPAGVYSYYKWIPEDPTRTAGGGVVFRTPAAFKLAAISYSGGSFRLSVNTTSGFRVFFITPSLSPNTEVIISHGATIDPTLSNFSMTIGGVPASFTSGTPGNGFNNSGSTTLTFNSRRAIGCFLAKV
jgi:hypothetical protein